MAVADDTDRSRRRGGWAPYALLSPGVLWLVLFFLVPVFYLVHMALSVKENRFVPLEFSWEWSNFGAALESAGSKFPRSFLFAGIATVLCLLIGYPMAYVMAFRGGRYRNLLLGLVVVPFFTSFLVRTISWTILLGDSGPVLSVVRSLQLDGLLESLGLLDNGRLMNTPQAVIGGLTYNFLPFMILPLYVSLEKIDPRLIDAAKDLYSNSSRAFRKVVFPLSLPGVFAGCLLVFIPAAGDFINADFLGGTGDKMIGNEVQRLFLEVGNQPEAAALALILMGIITVAVLVYAAVFGTDELGV